MSNLSHSVPPVTRGEPAAKKQPLSLGVSLFLIFFVGALSYGAGFFNSELKSATGLGRDDLDLSSVQETYAAAAKNFDGDIDRAKLIEGANRGLVDALGDDYTVFMNSKESQEYTDALEGNHGSGVGIEVGLRNGTPTVLRVLKDNPAERAGIQSGDTLVAVNGENVADKSVQEAVSKILGEAETTVKLTVNRQGEEKEFTMTREVINDPSAYGEIKDGVGVMTISRFDTNTGDLARAVARDFKDKNVKAVVLDLRGNGGGYVTAAQDVAGIWLNNELVVSERRNGRSMDELKTGKNTLLEGVPTVVVVNKSSASASEIVAGALRDHGAAKLLGETTFGKGSVQKMVNLSYGAMLKVTIARWYTPAGVNISETGIKPDVEVERTAEDLNASRDPQLDAALKLVLNRDA